MNSYSDQKPQLVARLFAMATARCEDRGTIAATCQGHLSEERLVAGARELLSHAEDLITIGMAVELLLARNTTT